MADKAMKCRSVIPQLCCYGIELGIKHTNNI